MSVAASSNPITPCSLSRMRIPFHRHWSSICCLNICPDFWLNLPAQDPTNKPQNCHLERGRLPFLSKSPSLFPLLSKLVLGDAWGSCPKREGCPRSGDFAELHIALSYKSYCLRQKYKIQAQGILINGEETSSKWEYTARGCRNWRGLCTNLMRLARPFSCIRFLVCPSLVFDISDLLS